MTMMAADEAVVDFHAKAKAIVPEGEDDGLVGEIAGVAAALPLVAQRTGEEAQGPGSDPPERALGPRGDAGGDDAGGGRPEIVEECGRVLDGLVG